ncbi:MAG: hypothetical protein ACOC5G_03275 [Acidobacteriota bacterium]
MQTVPLEKKLVLEFFNPLAGENIFTQEQDFEKKETKEMVLSAIDSLSLKRRMVMKLHLTGSHHHFQFQRNFLLLLSLYKTV